MVFVLLRAKGPIYGRSSRFSTRSQGSANSDQVSVRVGGGLDHHQNSNRYRLDIQQPRHHQARGNPCIVYLDTPFPTGGTAPICTPQNRPSTRHTVSFVDATLATGTHPWLNHGMAPMHTQSTRLLAVTSSPASTTPFPQSPPFGRISARCPLALGRTVLFAIIIFTSLTMFPKVQNDSWGDIDQALSQSYRGRHTLHRRGIDRPHIMMRCNHPCRQQFAPRHRTSIKCTRPSPHDGSRSDSDGVTSACAR